MGEVQGQHDRRVTTPPPSSLSEQLTPTEPWNHTDSRRGACCLLPHVILRWSPGSAFSGSVPPAR